MKILPILCFLAAGVGLAGCAREEATTQPEINASAQTSSAPAAPNTVDPAEAAILVRAEQIRTDCIENRRVICGRVLKVATNGLVIDSGYTDLLRPPLEQSWVVPGSVSVSRNPNALELSEPGSPCVGLVFLTDLPRRQKAKKYDYVVIIGYPAGHYVYLPVPGVERTIRRFAAGLDTAVRLRLKAEEKNFPANERASN